MLNRLYIRNIALIRDAELTFGKGMTVITGETGAGKSMLVDALSLALGDRADLSLLRHGAQEATVEATFQTLPDHPIHQALADVGISAEDGEIVMRRVLGQDKTRSFVNGVRVTQTQMRTIGEGLVDIHSQYDNQALLSPARHAGFLDTFAALVELAQKTTTAWESWRRVKQQRENLLSRGDALRREEALLTAYINEIEALAPRVGEREELAAERQRLMASEKLIEVFHTVGQLMEGNGLEMPSIADRMTSVEREIASVAPHAGEEMERLHERVTSLSEEVNDLAREIDTMSQTFSPDPQRLENVEDRLFALKDCARKHGVSTDELPTLLEKFNRQLDEMSLTEEGVSDLQKREAEAWQKFLVLGEELAKKRRRAAENLSAKIQGALQSLHMPKARFVVRFTPLEIPTAEGLEGVEFFISANEGNPPAPLAKIASGGEVSRLMLALKDILYKNALPMTLVFDEVDTGVSGAVAESVGERLSNMGHHHQVIAITHLPQVAARATEHIRIRKHTDGDEIVTSVHTLDKIGRKEELARMLSGKDVTDAARDAAISLLGSSG